MAATRKRSRGLVAWKAATGNVVVNHVGAVR